MELVGAECGDVIGVSFRVHPSFESSRHIDRSLHLSRHRSSLPADHTCWLSIMEPSPLTQVSRPELFQPKIISLYETLFTVRTAYLGRESWLTKSAGRRGRCRPHRGFLAGVFLAPPRLCRSKAHTGFRVTGRNAAPSGAFATALPPRNTTHPAG